MNMLQMKKPGFKVWNQALRIGLLFGIASSSALMMDSRALAAGDPNAGKNASAVCVACHGPQGISPNPLWPNLAGQKEEYIIKQLKAFRSEERKDPVMVPQAKQLSDEKIDDLAAYFAGLPR